MNRLDQAINDISNETMPAEHMEQAAARVRRKLFVQAVPTTERIRNCSDYQSLIPSYLSRTLSAGRALLLQDHTRECPACRHALEQARSGTVRMLARPVTPPSRTIPKYWAIAAAAVLTAGVGALILSRTFYTGGGHIAVQSVTGILYAVSDGALTPIFPGREIGEGQKVRTAKDSTAVVRLADGSLVELNERAEISVGRGLRGTTVHLGRGNIIVQAARQRNGTLDVLTADCTVSVKGTIFAVDRGTRGSRVSVVEGSVQVAQGSEKQLLKPGQQVSTDPSVAATSVRDAVSWSRDSTRYLALLGEFSVIRKGLEAMPSQAARHDSKLLNLLPENTVLYAAIPNLGTTLTEAERLFEARLQESPVLREWWDQQKDGPKLQQMVQKLRTFSDYLGDEVVFSIAGDWSGNYSQPMVLAEVKKPGLDAFLENEFRQASLNGATAVPSIVAIAKVDAASPRSYRRASRKAGESGPMMIGIKDNLVALTWNQAQLDDLAQRIAEPDANAGQNGLLAHVREAYGRGAGWLLCVNMETIARSLSDRPGGDNSPKLPPGLDAMRYLIIERKDVNGKADNQATLTFEGRRSGVAAWLAEPAPMGSLDFVSPNATFAASLVLRSPQRMMGDLFQWMSQHDPNFDENLARLRNESGVPFGSMLAAEALGGEMTFAIDGPVLPLPSWKLAVEVYSPDRLESSIEQLVDAVNKNAQAASYKLTLVKEQANNRAYYTLTSSRFTYEIDYTFVDGYLLAAPSRALLNTAIQNRATGYVLAHSQPFRSQLPAGGNLNFSGLVYHNLGTTLKPFTDQLAAVSGISPAQRASLQALGDNTGPGMVFLYGQPDQITIASSSGGLFGVDLNSLALPGLLSGAMQSKKE